MFSSLKYGATSWVVLFKALVVPSNISDLLVGGSGNKPLVVPKRIMACCPHGKSHLFLSFATP
jgi:hypothetical protein